MPIREFPYALTLECVYLEAIDNCRATGYAHDIYFAQSEIGLVYGAYHINFPPESRLKFTKLARVTINKSGNRDEPIVEWVTGWIIALLPNGK